MEKCIKKYCLKYVVRNAILISCIAIPISILVLVVSCIYNTTVECITEIFLPIIFGAVFFVLSNLFIFNFYKTIHEQEKKYGVIFNDKNAEKLCALIYLTDEWLIDCGTKAVLRKNIQGINYEYERALRGGHAIRVTIITEDMVYKINVFEQNHIEKLKLWYTYSEYKLCE